MRRRRNYPRKAAFITASLLVLVLAACRPAATPVPPSPTPFPIYKYVSPTPPPVFQTEAVQTATPSGTQAPTASGSQALDPAKVAAGQSRYTALACDSCHGADGKGTPKGSSLIGMTLNQDDFITFLRTGGNVGTSHEYAANRLSDTGAGNLYLYVLSLSQSK